METINPSNKEAIYFDKLTVSIISQYFNSRIEHITSPLQQNKERAFVDEADHFACQERFLNYTFKADVIKELCSFDKQGKTFSTYLAGIILPVLSKYRGTIIGLQYFKIIKVPESDVFEPDFRISISGVFKDTL